MGRRNGLTRVAPDLDPDDSGVEVAVLDRNGVIVSVNDAWREFCVRNGGDLPRCGVGTSYLAVCERAGDQTSRQVASAIRSAIGGLLLVPVRLRFSCDAPSQARTFEVFVASRWADDGSCLGAIVTLARAGVPDLPISVADRERLVAQALDAIGDAVVVLDARTGRRRYVNRAVLERTGYSREELAAVPVAASVRREDRERLRLVIADVVAGRVQEAMLDAHVRHRDGHEIPAEMRVSYLPNPLDGDRPGHVVLVVRDITERARQSAQTELIATVVTAVLAEEPIVATYQKIVTGVAAAFDAENVVLIFPGVDGGPPTVGAAVGQVGLMRLRGELTSVPDGLAAVIEKARLLLPPMPPEPGSPGTGPRMAARFLTRTAGPGVLGASRPVGGEPFTEHELDQLAGLADHLSLAVRLSESRFDAQRLAVLEDRQRLAQDLEDTVLQDVVAVGMQLDRVAQRVGDPELLAGIGEIVRQLDAASERLRGRLFELNDHRPTSFDALLGDVVADAARLLGHMPVVTCCGEVDAVPATLVRSAVAVVREALSNVARHSGATRTSVAIDVDEARLEVVVEDDGAGVAGQRVRGQGVATIRQRASLHGGTAEVGEAVPRGTRVRWTVPLR